MVELIDFLFPFCAIAGVALVVWSTQGRPLMTRAAHRTVYETGRDRLEASSDDVVVYVNDREVWRGPGPVTLRSDISAVVNGDCTTVASGGSVRCGKVAGDVQANGSVTCPTIQGSVQAGGSVRAGTVGGSVTAGGSVTMVERAK